MRIPILREKTGEENGEFYYMQFCDQFKELMGIDVMQFREAAVHNHTPINDTSIDIYKLGVYSLLCNTAREWTLCLELAEGSPLVVAAATWPDDDVNDTTPHKDEWVAVEDLQDALCRYNEAIDEHGFKSSCICLVLASTDYTPFTGRCIEEDQR